MKRFTRLARLISLVAVLGLGALGCSDDTKSGGPAEGEGEGSAVEGEGEGEGAEIGEGEGEGEGVAVEGEGEGAKEGEGEGEGQAEPECAAGEVDACDCPSGAMGQKECTAAGAWGQCGCATEGEGEGATEGEGEGEGQDEPICIPGERDLCFCEDGREGESTCTGDGMAWGDCVCAAAEWQDTWTPRDRDGELPVCDRVLPDQQNWGHASILSALVIDGRVGFDQTGDGRIDNSLGNNFMLPALANGEIANSIAEGGVIVIFELQEADDPVNEDCFTMAGYLGWDSDEPADPSDNFSGNESFLVDARSFDAEGYPQISFGQSELTGGYLWAGPAVFLLSVPIDADTTITLPIRNTQIQAEVQADWSLKKGVLGGAVVKDEVLQAVADAGFEIPEGIDPDMILGPADVDVDGDGTPEAYSIGATFETIPAVIGGVTEGPEIPLE